MKVDESGTLRYFKTRSDVSGPELLILLKPRINSLDGICFFQNGNPHFDDQNQQNGSQNQHSGSQNQQRGTQNQQRGAQNQQSGKARNNKSGRATYMPHPPTRRALDPSQWVGLCRRASDSHPLTRRALDPSQRVGLSRAREAPDTHPPARRDTSLRGRLPSSTVGRDQ